MTMNKRRRILWMIALLAVVSPARADDTCRTPDGFLDRGIGGTGYAPDADGDKGVGGTGLHADRGVGGTGIASGGDDGLGGTGVHADRGIGGTGIDGGGIGGTGVRTVYVSGTIYAYGSVCVNGLRITYTDNTPVQDGAAATNAKSLQLGQFVHVVADKVPGAHSLTARSITVSRAIEGPITDMNPAKGTVRVMGEQLRVPPSMAAALRVGETVRVSGLRNENREVVPTHIEPGAPSLPQKVTGPVSIGNDGRAMVGNTPVEFSGSSRPAEGAVVSVSGEWSGRALAASRVEQDQGASRSGPGLVSVEGYVENVNADGRIRMGGREIRVSGSDEKSMRRGERVIISGVMDAKGNVKALQVEERRNVRAYLSERSGESGGDDHSGHGGGDGGGDDHSGSGHGGDSGGHGGSERSDNSGHGGSSGGDRPDRSDHSGHGGGDRPDRSDHSGHGGRN